MSEHKVEKSFNNEYQMIHVTVYGDTESVRVHFSQFHHGRIAEDANRFSYEQVKWFKSELHALTPDYAPLHSAFTLGSEAVNWMMDQIERYEGKA